MRIFKIRIWGPCFPGMRACARGDPPVRAGPGRRTGILSPVGLGLGQKWPSSSSWGCSVLRAKRRRNITRAPWRVRRHLVPNTPELREGCVQNLNSSGAGQSRRKRGGLGRIVPKMRQFGTFLKKIRLYLQVFAKKCPVCLKRKTDRVDVSRRRGQVSRPSSVYKSQARTPAQKIQGGSPC